MTTNLRLAVAGIISILSTGIAVADDLVAPLPRPIFNGGLAVPGAGYYGGAYFAGGTTAHESILRGHATVIRAKGEAALLHAEALRSLEEAKSRFLDNEVKRLAVRQERRRMGTAERALYYEDIQRKRETQLALNRVAREGHAAAIESVSVESKADHQLQLALDLLRGGEADAGVASLQQITQQFGQTEAGQQAASILAELNS